jgi:undecaprenyl diphosphate synthase
LSRENGHYAGVTTLGLVIEAAPSFGIGTLSVYAFSTENWRRPPHEVEALMALLSRFLGSEIDRLAELGVRVTVIGRRDRLSSGIADLIARAEAATASSVMLDLRIAVDYSARDAILDAVSAGAATPLTREAVSHRLELKYGGPDVDLLIRTSGEQRLSDFMLWEAAYAELYFTEVLWPDFDRAALEQALADYRSRERRFGGLPRGTARAASGNAHPALPSQIADRLTASPR